MQPTLLSILQKTTEYFGGKCIASPRLNAELLLAHLLNLPRLQLYLQFDRPFQDEELVRFRELVRERGERKPLQYITGTAHFRELALTVDAHVLIPRPETEVVVEKAIEKIGQTGPSRVLDFGTGSGCIGLSIIKELPNTVVTCVDCSAQALAVAQENCRKNGLDESRIRWVHANTLDDFPGTFDVMVSNPPYVAENDAAKLEPELSYEPKEALFGGKDGLDYYRMFARKAPSVLVPNGWLLLELGFGQKEAVMEIFGQTQCWENIVVHTDLSGIPRVFEARVK